MHKLNVVVLHLKLVRSRLHITSYKHVQIKLLNLAFPDTVLYLTMELR